MENNYFVFTNKNSTIEIERFHICTWEFKNNTALVEFGAEIKKNPSKDSDEISLNLYIPWITSKHKITDLYDNLKSTENTRFIFNDSVTGSENLDEGQQRQGVIQKFKIRTIPLCILPIKSTIKAPQNVLTILINLKKLNKKSIGELPNIYIRFKIETELSLLSTRKAGINKSTIIYDLKLNERRNLPEKHEFDPDEINLCNINSCFALHILPNSFGFTFLESSSLKGIRTLESDSFKKYLDDNRIKKDELVVIFNKKRSQDSYTFFSVFSKERIGASQFFFAVLVNLFSAIILTFLTMSEIYRGQGLPIVQGVLALIGVSIVAYFVWPLIQSTTQKMKKFK